MASARKVSKKTLSSPSPHSKAWLTFEQNLDGVKHLVALSKRELTAMKVAVNRLVAALRKPGALTPTTAHKAQRAVERCMEGNNATTERINTAHLWQTVMLVTCVEAYLQDILSAAASVDQELMSKSEQRALYAEVVAATSLDDLSNQMRARWAQGWVNDGGPSRWIARLTKMGARGYPADLEDQLETVWGIRHIVVHAAGVSNAEFVKRHPNIVLGVGDRVRDDGDRLIEALSAVGAFMEPTEMFFLSRWPSLGASQQSEPRNKKLRG